MLLALALLTTFSLWIFSPTFHSSVASTASAKPDCSNIFLYIPHDISNNGICSQLQNYILALHVAATFHRTLLVWEPALEQVSQSPFGCFPEETEAGETHTRRGLQQILAIPSSHACSRALCHHNHSEWTRVLSSSFNEFPIVTCDTTSVMVSGGRKLRRHYVQRLHQTRQQLNFTHWVSNLRQVTPMQLEWFQHTKQEDPWRGVAGLLAPHIQWQPLLQPTLARHMQQLHLPLHYTALHVRRGDKLKREAATMVQQYWASRGDNPDGLNYIPLNAYVDKLNPSIDPPDVYIATDDPVTIRNEVAHLEATSHYWKFHLLADRRPKSGHMNTEPDCHVRYNMTVEAIVDLEVMIRAQVFVGELNSNWGRFIQTMRTEFIGANPVLRDFRVVFGDNQTRYLGQ